MASLTQWTWVWADYGVGDGQGDLACCDSWGRKESDTAERLNWTIQSMKFSRPEQWSGLPFPSPGDLPNPGLLHCRQILYQLSHQGSPVCQSSLLTPPSQVAALSSTRARSKGDSEAVSPEAVQPAPWSRWCRARLTVFSSRDPHHVPSHLAGATWETAHTSPPRAAPTGTATFWGCLCPGSLLSPGSAFRWGSQRRSQNPRVMKRTLA